MHGCKVKSREGGYPNVEVEPSSQNFRRKFRDAKRIDGFPSTRSNARVFSQLLG